MATDDGQIRLLMERAAQSLEAVLPHVDNHYARLQLRALGEMLRNIAPRVEERSDLHDAALERTQRALDSLAELSDSPRGASTQSVGDVREELAARIGAIYEPASAGWRDQALAAVWSTIRADFEAEALLIRASKAAS